MEDRTPLCSRWKEHGACDLDRDFVLNGTNQGLGQVGFVKVTSWEMFHFMQRACLGSCGWTNDKVSID